MTIQADSWPDDADGDVFRSLHRQGFDFSRPCTIDFTIDFRTWPPVEEGVAAIKKEFVDAKIYRDGKSGYILFRIVAPLTYHLVIETQAKATEVAAPYGGLCESWGVLH